MTTFTDISKAFVLQNNGAAISIDRFSGFVAAVEPEKATLAGAGKDSETIAGALGIIELPFSKYLILATTSRLAGKVGEESIFRVTGTRIVPFTDSHGKDEDYLALLRAHLATATLYYSPSLDLTSSFQRTASFTAENKQPLVDERFFWNLTISRDLLPFPQFVFPVIYGVFSEAKLNVKGHPIQFGLITRRSRFRAGTRYFRRGLDSQGHAANFNETEQFFIIGQRIFSYVQTRGSVPALWGEVNTLRYRPTLQIGDFDGSVAAAAKHFAEQKRIYGPQYLVNLVNQSGYEKAVKDTYERVVEALNDPELLYLYFDFHHECSKMRWYRVQILIDRLLELGLDKTQWFEASGGDILNRQTGAVRTNCMDCLDRTNVVQSCIAMFVLQRQLEAAGVLTDGTKIADDTEFMLSFRNIWADNADGVSVAYSGTGALKTDFTRTGQRTKLGALQDFRNSVWRYYGNNLLDGPRQDGFSLFLGDYVPQSRGYVFSDRRSLWIQAVPYLLGGSALVALLSLRYPSERHSTIFNTFMTLLFTFAAVVSLRFIFSHGLQYVNWPKLTPLDYVRWSPRGYVMSSESPSTKED